MTTPAWQVANAQMQVATGYLRNEMRLPNRRAFQENRFSVNELELIR
jgi:hypothetical protein